MMLKAGRVDVPVSIGELVDKICILEIKAEKIEDGAKLDMVRRELEVLRKILSDLALDSNPNLARLMKDLAVVNHELWNVEDRIRLKERNRIYDSEFIELARAVYIKNDERSYLKQQINKETGSELGEVKKYESY